jgi:hypothetical protein
VRRALATLGYPSSIAGLALQRVARRKLPEQDSPGGRRRHRAPWRRFPAAVGYEGSTGERRRLGAPCKLRAAFTEQEHSTLELGALAQTVRSAAGEWAVS